ncbi:family 1 glycosylhydrolase [Serratia ureilytica]
MNPYRGWGNLRAEFTTSLPTYGIITAIRAVLSPKTGWALRTSSVLCKGQIHDDYRIDFISEHLKWLHKGISEGCHCLGYHMWTFIDNWSWLNGYKNRYGFVQLI